MSISLGDLEDVFENSNPVLGGPNLVRPLLKVCSYPERLVELIFNDFDQPKIRNHIMGLGVKELLTLQDNFAKVKTIENISFRKPSEWLLDYGHMNRGTIVSHWVERMEFIESIITTFYNDYNLFKNDLSKNLDKVFKAESQRLTIWAFLNPTITDERDQKKYMYDFMIGKTSLERLKTELHAEFIKVGLNKIGEPEEQTVKNFYFFFSPDINQHVLLEMVFGR
ncbi:MAG: hypothetical protein KF802_02890 [Bdellovibrionaceae bacterium]|nr:hypothetical protein [Pseudobdellovibrionaceae bacterium]